MKVFVILTETLYSNIMFQAMLDNGPANIEIVGVNRSSKPFNKLSYFAGTMRILKNYSFAFFASKVCETIIYQIACRGADLLEKIGGRSNIRMRMLDRIAQKYKFPIYDTEDVNSKENVQMIRDKNPDVIISINGNQRLRKGIISIPRKACINVHVAPLPLYRGVCPYFWVLRNGEKESGVTVHHVDEDFDTGLIIRQSRFQLNDDDSAQSVFLKGTIEGKRLLSESLLEIAEDRAGADKQPDGTSSYYSWPKPEDYREFKRRGKKLWDLKKFLHTLTLEGI